MNDMFKADSGHSLGIASTHGWDTAYGIRFASVNAAISAKGSSPTDFDHSETSGGETNRVFGPFAAWSITGGSGHLLEMQVPIPSFTYEPDGQPAISRSDAVALITVELEAIPQPGAASGTDYALKIRLPNRSNASVSVTSFDYPGSESDGEIPEVVRLLLQGWMRTPENLARFNHTFAVVNLNGKAAVGDLQWVMPTHLAYGVVAAGAEDGVFAVLCMTEGKSPPPDEMVSVDLVPPGVNAAFLISKERYLTKMILPGLGFMFSEPQDKKGRKWPDDYFELGGNGTLLRNRFDIAIDRFRTEHGDVRATMAAGEMTITLEDLFLELRMTGFTHPYRAGWFNAIHSITSRLQATVNEDQKFILMPATSDKGTPIIHHRAVLEKTPLAEAMDYVVLAIEIAAFVIPIGQLAYARYAGAAAEATATGAQVAADVTQVAPATAEAAEVVLAEGAVAVAEAAEQGAVTLSKFLIFNSKSLHAIGMLALAGIPIGLSEFQRIASNSNMAADEIPDIKAFVSGIMQPVQWPEAEAEFHVDRLAFNGGLHVIGTPLVTS